MDQVKIENLNGSPYSGARYLYNDLHDDTRHETVDLLQMVADNDRQNNNNSNTSAANTAPGTIATPTTTQVAEQVNRVQCQPDNNIYPENIQTYYSQSSRDHEQYSHLCQKHARQLENKSNTMCERQPGYYKDEDPYYSRVPNPYRDGKSMDKTDTGTVYFNYLKQFKRKGSQNRSTQSLPAVTYTLNKSNNKYLFKKPNLFKSSNVKNNYSTGSISKTGEYPVKDSYSGIKRLLIIVCILVGVVLALGGIIIGFVIVPGKQRNAGDHCGEDSIYCPELGCILVSTVCTDPDFVCPGYTAMAVCGLPSIKENVSNSDQDQPTEAQEPEVRLPSVTSHLIYGKLTSACLS